MDVGINNYFSLTTLSGYPLLSLIETTCHTTSRLPIVKGMWCSGSSLLLENDPFRYPADRSSAVVTRFLWRFLGRYSLDLYRKNQSRSSASLVEWCWTWQLVFCTAPTSQLAVGWVDSSRGISTAIYNNDKPITEQNSIVLQLINVNSAADLKQLIAVINLLRFSL